MPANALPLFPSTTTISPGGTFPSGESSVLNATRPSQSSRAVRCARRAQTGQSGL